MKHPDASVRHKAASALSFSFLREPDVVGRYEAALLDACKDSDPRVRSTAAVNLGRVKTSSALRALIELVEDEAPAVRATAARGLGELADPESLGALTKAAGDPDDYVMAAATDALEKISPGHPAASGNFERLWSMLGKSQRDHYAACLAYGRMGTERSLGVLLHYLKSRHKSVRLHALMGLKHAPVIPDLGPVEDCLKDEDESCRMHAAWVLEAANPPELVQLVAPLMDDAHAGVRSIATALLFKKGYEPARARVAKMLESEDEGERKWAKALIDS